MEDSVPELSLYFTSLSQDTWNSIDIWVLDLGRIQMCLQEFGFYEYWKQNASVTDLAFLITYLYFTC